jgi:CRP/FNR family transcriptional regulator, anaerobic regulatory protein
MRQAMRGYSAVSIDRPQVPAAVVQAGISAGALGLPVKFDKHRPVFMAGDDAERFFEVESGAVMLYRILDDGRRQVVEIVFAGGICGLAASAVHESCCETLMPSVLRSYKKTDLARSDALRTRISEKLQAQLASMHDHVVTLGRKTAQERVCTLILKLRDIEHPPVAEDGGEGAIALPMTRTEIADYLGLTLETVCRTLTDLNRRKLVEQGRKKTEYRVKDLSKLKRAACWDA